LTLKVELPNSHYVVYVIVVTRNRVAKNTFIFNENSVLYVLIFDKILKRRV